MSPTIKNILTGIVGVVVLIFLFVLAWKLAGVLIRLIVSLAILGVLIWLIWYFYNQLRARR